MSAAEHQSQSSIRERRRARQRTTRSGVAVPAVKVVYFRDPERPGRQETGVRARGPELFAQL